MKVTNNNIFKVFQTTILFAILITVLINGNSKIQVNPKAVEAYISDENIQDTLIAKYKDNFIRVADGVVYQNEANVTDDKQTKKSNCKDDVHCTCLAYNLYHEARGESIEGKVAVAKVTMNRVKDKGYANNICDVVKQYKQFSWTLENDNFKWKINNDILWKEANIIAYNTVHENYNYDLKALHYHTVNITKRWSQQMQVEKVIGNHLFFMKIK